MRIAICDDQKEFLSIAEKMIKKICLSEKIPVKVDSFLNPQYLIGAFTNNEYDYDLVFLDIEMPQMNGKICAKKLQEYNKHFKLFFITSYKDEVYSSFEYNICGFLPKSMLQSRLHNEMIRVLNQINEEQKEWYVFEVKTDKNENVKIKIPLSDIMYFESINRKIYMHTLKNFFILRGSGFENLKKRMLKNGFVEIHRLSIVNLDCIYNIKDDYLELDNHELLQISRQHVKQVLRAFLDYLKQDLI